MAGLSYKAGTALTFATLAFGIADADAQEKFNKNKLYEKPKELRDYVPVSSRKKRSLEDLVKNAVEGKYVSPFEFFMAAQEYKHSRGRYPGFKQEAVSRKLDLAARNFRSFLPKFKKKMGKNFNLAHALIAYFAELDIRTKNNKTASNVFGMGTERSSDCSGQAIVFTMMWNEFVKKEYDTYKFSPFMAPYHAPVGGFYLGKRVIIEPIWIRRSDVEERPPMFWAEKHLKHMEVTENEYKNGSAGKTWGLKGVMAWLINDEIYENLILHIREVRKKAINERNRKNEKKFAEYAAQYQELVKEQEKLIDIVLSLTPQWANYHSYKAHILELKRETDRAIKHLEKGIRHDPDSLKIRQRLALMLSQKGNSSGLQNALRQFEEFRKSLERVKNEVGVYRREAETENWTVDNAVHSLIMPEANSLYLLAQNRQSLRLIENALKELELLADLDDASNSSSFSSSRENEENQERQRPPLEKVLGNLRKNDAKKYLALYTFKASLHGSLGDKKTANRGFSNLERITLKQLEKMNSRNKEDKDEINKDKIKNEITAKNLQLSKLMYEQGKYLGALKYINDAKRISGKTSEAFHIFEADILDKLNRHKEALLLRSKAIPLADKTASRDARNRDLIINFAELLRKHHSYSLAVRIIDYAINLDRTFAPSFITKGKLLRAQGNYKTAVDAFSNAIECNPYYWESWLERGKTFYHSRDYANALPDLEMARNLRQKNRENPAQLHPEILLKEANMHGGLIGSTLAGIARLALEDRLDSQYSGILKQKDFLKYYSGAQKTPHLIARDNAKLAEAYALSGDYGNARRFFNLALSLSPNDSGIACSYGKYILSRGQGEEALQQFIASYRSNPFNQEALSGIVNVCLELGNEATRQRASAILAGIRAR